MRRLYGLERADQAAHKLPPRPIVERWGSAQDVGTVLDKATQEETSIVFSTMLDELEGEVCAKDRKDIEDPAHEQ